MQNNISKDSKTIFVGNVPYSTDEETIISLFSHLGNINSFKMVFDRETRKRKGFGFMEFDNAESAKKALKTMDNVFINGRNLRVGPANESSTPEDNTNKMSYESNKMGYESNKINYELNTNKTNQMNFLNYNNMPHPSIPEPVKSEPVQVYQQTITVLPSEKLEVPTHEIPEDTQDSQMLNDFFAQMSCDQVFQFMKSMKECIQNNAQGARDLLIKNSSMTYALLQLLIEMNVIDVKIVLALLTRSEDQIPPASKVTNSNPVNFPIMSSPQQPSLPQQTQQQQIPTPILINMSQPPPSMNPHNFPINTNIVPPTSTAPPMSAMPVDQNEVLLRQVMTLTDEQLRGLNHEQRQAILLVRNQFMNSNIMGSN